MTRHQKKNIRKTLTVLGKQEREHEMLSAIDELLAWIHLGCSKPEPLQAILMVVNRYRQVACVQWMTRWTEDGSSTDPIVSGMEPTITALDDLERFVAPYLSREPYSDFLWTHRILRNPDPPNFIADTVEEFLRKRLAQMDPAALPGLRYSSLEQFVLQNGRHYRDIKSPTGYPKLPSGCCFANAKLLANRCELIYVEGFALPRHFRWPKFHGWNLDMSGRVIDCTWEDDGKDYFGLSLNIAVLNSSEEMSRFINFSVLDRPKKWAFLK